jgi:hypothetical protein
MPDPPNGNFMGAMQSLNSVWRVPAAHPLPAILKLPVSHGRGAAPREATRVLLMAASSGAMLTVIGLVWLGIRWSL